MAKPVEVYYIKETDGMITISKDNLKEMLDNNYNIGFEDGKKIYQPYVTTTSTPSIQPFYYNTWQNSLDEVSTTVRAIPSDTVRSIERVCEL